MKLMSIQELEIALGNLEDLAAQTPDDGVRGQQKVAFDTVFVRRKPDSDHRKPPPKRTVEPSRRQDPRRWPFLDDARAAG